MATLRQNISHMTACTLVSYHNMWFYLKMMESLRRAINEDTFPEYKEKFLATYRSGREETRAAEKEEG